MVERSPHSHPLRPSRPALSQSSTYFWRGTYPLDDFVAIVYPENDPAKPKNIVDSYTVQEHHVFTIDLVNQKNQTIRWHYTLPVTTAPPKVEAPGNPSEIVRKAIERRKSKDD